jgi:galactokinase
VTVIDVSFDKAADALGKTLGAPPASRLFVPGRIEILGKHTDYAGGRSITCAAGRGFAVVFAPRGDAMLRVVDAQDGRRVDLPLDGSVTPRLGHWSNYPATVVRRLARNFGELRRGADVAFHSSLPRAAGLSTSSALVTAIFMALDQVNGLRDRDDFRGAVPDDCALAGYLGCIENGRPFGGLAGDGGVGTSGGSEDHTAIVLSLEGAVSCYRYHPVERLHAFTLPPSLTLVVAASGIAAAKTGAARDRYNRAADLVSELSAIAGGHATLGEVVSASGDAPVNLVSAILRATSRYDARELIQRLDHFMEEEHRIMPAALDALARSDWDAFGQLVDRSQRAAEDLLGNQVPETMILQRLARELGAHAASAFGAGFGGSVWALVEAGDAADFSGRWLASYASHYPGAAARAMSFVTRPAAGVLTAS